MVEVDLRLLLRCSPSSCLAWTDMASRASRAAWRLLGSVTAEKDVWVLSLTETYPTTPSSRMSLSVMGRILGMLSLDQDMLMGRTLKDWMLLG